jgi:hypothetical protein
VGTNGGIGTIFYGWRHEGGGVATVTKWLVVFWLPVIPLGRYRIRMLNDPDDEPPVSLKVLGMAAVGAGAVSDSFEILERLPLDWRSALRTYVTGYVGVPLLIGAPVAAVVGLLILLIRAGVLDREGVAIIYASVAVVSLCIGYVLCVMATVVHRARGGTK